MIVAFSGKGGVGKTSLAALVLDELARRGCEGPVLAVDGDPAMTLHLALGVAPPSATLARVRDEVRLEARSVRSLPAGMSVTGYLAQELAQAGVLARRELNGLPLDLLAMGQGEGRGCYCGINNALKAVLAELVGRYSLVVVDNEAGLEWLNRYRLARLDHFVVVSTPAPAAQAVAERVIATAEEVGLEVGRWWRLLNRANGHVVAGSEVDLVAPQSWRLAAMERQGEPVVRLPVDSSLRRALGPLVEAVLCA